MLVILDFDDTAAVQNVARLLLDRFGDGEFTRIQASYSDGKIGFRDYQELAFHSLQAAVGELRSYAADAATLRPGFKETIAAAREAGAEIAIVSAGLDLYIEPVLERNGFESIPTTCVTTGGHRGPASSLPYVYPSARPGCPAEYGVCKCMAFESELAAGREVVFVGDGVRSDACAAARATTVFARSRLLDHCRNAGISARPFDDLFPVASHLRAAIAARRTARPA